jgi:hypothetical protein
MNGRQLTRRMVLGTFAVLMAVSTAQGSGGGASAADDGAFYVGGHGSKAGFQKSCKDAGGTFGSDDLGNTTCHYKQGGWEECDAKGGDCWFTPYREDGSGHPFDPSDWGVITDSPTAPDAQPSVAAPDDDPEQDTGKRKDKKNKKGKKDGKGRKK